ncbi:MAG: hypothetical protein ACW99A_09450 [Candidatus Kariarchaeaceae archaeon]
MRKESYFTEDLHSLKEYWEDKDRAVKFLSGRTRTGAIEYLLRRIEPDVHQGSWLDSGTGAGFIQSQIDSDVFPTLFVDHMVKEWLEVHFKFHFGIIHLMLFRTSSH